MNTIDNLSTSKPRILGSTIKSIDLNGRLAEVAQVIDTYTSGDDDAFNMLCTANGYAPTMIAEIARVVIKSKKGTTAQAMAVEALQRDTMSTRTGDYYGSRSEAKGYVIVYLDKSLGQQVNANVNGVDVVTIKTHGHSEALEIAEQLLDEIGDALAQ